MSTSIHIQKVQFIGSLNKGETRILLPPKATPNTAGTTPSHAEEIEKTK